MAKEKGGLTAWPTSRVLRPSSVAEEKGGLTVWPTSRPVSCMADFEACELRGQLQGPPAAWLMCDLFRWWLSVSTRGKVLVLKWRRCGQGELCLPPLHGT